jgi:hypothetical protein
MGGWGKKFQARYSKFEVTMVTPWDPLSKTQPQDFTFKKVNDIHFVQRSKNLTIGKQIEK